MEIFQKEDIDVKYKDIEGWTIEEYRIYHTMSEKVSNQKKE